MHAPTAAVAATAMPMADAIALASRGTRPAPYRLIHQGLRTLLVGTLQRCGALDAGVDADRACIVRDVERLLAACADHLAHENRFFHEPLRACAPRAVLPFEDDHLEHLQSIAALRLLLQRLRDAPDGEASSLGYELFLRLSIFVGENLEHMAEEESRMTQALWAHFGDAEIEAMHGDFQATLSP